MQITVTRVEGAKHESGRTVMADSFPAINAVLRQWSGTAPLDGSYHKCDFRLVDTDLEIDYRGRYDLVHWSRGPADLRRHITEHLDFLAGLACPAHLDGAAYQRLLDDVYRMTPAQHQKIRLLREQLAQHD